MFEASSVGIATAFAGGVISFLSPCVLPLVPGYVSYVAGTSLEELRDDSAARRRAVGYAVAFVLGFSCVFMALGASATVLGQTLLAWRYELSIAAGVIVILFGLHLLGVTPWSAMQRDTRFHLDVPGGRVTGSFLLGVAFAFGWTPCIGPVLGAILTMSASSADVAHGAMLLAFYSAGLGLPFLLAALFTDRLLGRLSRLTRYGAALQRVAGALLLVMGVLMLTGRIEAIAYWLLESFPGLASIG